MNVSFAVKAPSVTVKVTVEEPNAFVTGLIVTVQLGEVPAIVMSVFSNTDVLLDDFEMELAQLSEESTSEMVKVIADVEIFACVRRSLIDEIVGASLTAFTVNVKVSLEDNEPSETVSEIVDVPEALATGARVTVQLGAVPPMTIPLEAMTDVLLDDLLTEVAQFSVLSTSETVNAIALVDVSSSVDLFVTSEIVGASLTAFTVKIKVSLEDNEPSETVRVIVADPEALATGVRVAVQFGAAPSITMEAFASTEVLLLLAVTDVIQFKVSSASAIVNDIAPVAVSSFVDRSDTSEIVGAVFPLPPVVPPDVPPDVPPLAPPTVPLAAPPVS